MKISHFFEIPDNGNIPSHSNQFHFKTCDFFVTMARETIGKNWTRYQNNGSAERLILRHFLGVLLPDDSDYRLPKNKTPQGFKPGGVF